MSIRFPFALALPMRRPGARAFAALGLTLALSACGGGGGGSDAAGATEIQTVLVRTTSLYYGDVDHTGFAFDSGGTVSVAPGSSAPMFIGDSSDDEVAHGFLRIDLAGLPSAGTIEAATLTLAQETVVGTPYLDLGHLRVDHIDMQAGLDAADYTSPVVLDLGLGTLATDATLGTLELDVTDAVARAHASGASVVDFRLRFVMPTDGDGVADYVAFETPADLFGSGRVPTLSVTTLE